MSVSVIEHLHGERKLWKVDIRQLRVPVGAVIDRASWVALGDMEVPSPEPILDDIIAESQNHRRLTRPALEDTRMMIVRESVGGIHPR